jgi:hypothetical protein
VAPSSVLLEIVFTEAAQFQFPQRQVAISFRLESFARSTQLFAIEMARSD